MNVVDASVSVKWVYDEAGAQDARKLLETETILAAPALWRLETANTLVRKSREGRLSTQEVRDRLDYLHGLPLVMVGDGALLPDALSLSLTLQHPLYDCLYLALATRERSRLFTADRPFMRAAARGGYGASVTLVGADQP